MDTPRGGASDGFEAARAWLTAQTLPLPYIPPALAAQMRALGDYTFSTRDPLPTKPLWIPGWLEDLAAAPDDYAVIAYDGRGSAKHAVHVFVAVGPLAVFLQLPWGGAFGDDAQLRALAAKLMGDIRPLVEAAEQRAGAPRRWALVISNFEKSGWRALPDGEWHRDDVIGSLRREMGID